MVSTPKLSECLSLGNLPEPLGDMPGLVVKDRFYIFGGGCGQEVRDTILSIDADTGVCTQIGKMPYGSRGHQAVLLDEDVYLLGGFDDDGTKDDVWRLNLETGSAQKQQPMPTSNAWFAATAHNGNIVVTGGFSIPNGYLDQIYTYDPKEDKWSVYRDAFASDIFPKRKLGSNSILSDSKNLFSFGGADEFNPEQGRANALGLVCYYDMVHQSWHTLPQQIHPREGIVAVQHGHTGYLVGGMAEGADKPTATIEAVDLITQKIYEVARLKVGRLAPSVGIVNNKLIIAGGVIEPLYEMTDTIEYMEIKENS